MDGGFGHERKFDSGRFRSGCLRVWKDLRGELSAVGESKLCRRVPVRRAWFGREPDSRGLWEGGFYTYNKMKGYRNPVRLSRACRRYGGFAAAVWPLRKQGAAPERKQKAVRSSASYRLVPYLRAAAALRKGRETPRSGKGAQASSVSGSALNGGQVSSVYLAALPHAFSTGYLASFLVTFSFMISSRSKPHTSAIRMQ